MTYECKACDVRFHPYQCADGQCPCCWGGTVRSQEPASPDADERFQRAMLERVAREKSEHAHKQFRAFLEARQIAADAVRFAAQETGPIPVDAVRRGLAMRDDAYLRCVGCGWAFPIDTTDEHERCSQCDGELAIAHGGDDEPEQFGEAA